MTYVLGMIVGGVLMLIGWVIGRQGRADLADEKQHAHDHVWVLTERLNEMYGCRKQAVAPPKPKDKDDEPRRPIVVKRRMPPKP